MENIAAVLMIYSTNKTLFNDVQNSPKGKNIICSSPSDQVISLSSQSTDGHRKTA